MLERPRVPRLSNVYRIICTRQRFSNASRCADEKPGVQIEPGSFWNRQLVYFFPEEPLDRLSRKFTGKHNFSKGVDCAIFRDF
jgi:hypothetical protein